MERTDTINKRIADRTRGSIPPVYFSPRPVPTKYVALPMVDQRTPIQTVPPPPVLFDIQTNFLPSTSTPGFSHYVDTETQLMREKHYFPSSSSSLYKSPLFSNTDQPHPLLFKKPETVAQPRGLPKQWMNESTNIKLLNIQ
jgi:hypothetical protein